MSKKRFKQYLMLLTVTGLVAIAAGGGSGTFASFTAETVNPSNTFATGTLFLHNTVGAGTICASETAASNTNANCDTIFPSVTIKAGQTQVAYLTLKNAGSLNAPGVTFYEPACTEAIPQIAGLSSAVTSGASNGGSIAISALGQNLSKGTPIRVDDGTNHQTFTVSADTTAGATAIPVNTVNWSSSFALNTKVEIDTTAFTASPNLCGGLNFSIVEQTAANGGGSDVHCAWGVVSGNGCDTTNAGYALFGGANSPGTTVGAASPLTLTSAAGNGNAGTGLDAGGSRYFKLEVTAPSSVGNSAQNDKLTFDLHWDIAQS